MKKILSSDNSLKVISVLIAICIWIYISLVMDPAIEVTVRDLPIQFVGQEGLNNRGLAVISESATTVTVKVKGSRKKMGNNDMKTIIVKADVSAIDKEGTQSVPVEIVIPFESQGISSQSIYTVDVKTEKYTEKEVDVRVKAVGSAALDYIADTPVANPSKITVKGPESAVEKIVVANCTLNYNGADVDIDAELPVTFSGEDGKEISSLDAIMKRVSVSAERVKVHCPILKMRKVEVKANFGGQHLPDDFVYRTDPSEVFVYGADKILSELNEISTEEIPLDKLNDNKKIKVKLKIPNGIKVYNGISEAEISIED